MAKYKVTPAMVSAAGKRRFIPSLGVLCLRTNIAQTLTKNEDGEVSSPDLTREYVAEFCRKNRLKC
jgi:hypothetical protein